MKVGDLQQANHFHATLSIGVEQLPCLLSGESFNMEMIIKVIERSRLIDQLRGFGNGKTASQMPVAPRINGNNCK